MEEVVGRLCAALERALPADEEMGDDKLSKEVADFLMIRGVTEYDPKESIELAARVIEYGVDHVLMREMATATELLLDSPVPIFERVETVISRSEKELKELREKDPATTVKFVDLLLDKLVGLRVKRDNIAPEDAKSLIMSFDENRPKLAVRESTRRKKAAFNERTKKFEADAEKVVEHVKSESMRLKRKPSRPKLDALMN